LTKKDARTISDEDIERVIEELRFVLKNAATTDAADRKLILELTMTIEDLTEKRLNQVRLWDPSYGDTLVESLTVRREAIQRGIDEDALMATEEPEVKKKKRRKKARDKESKSLLTVLRSFRKNLGPKSSRKK
jgi:hypothetical protein